MAIDLNTNPIASSDPPFCLECGADVHGEERIGVIGRANGRGGWIEDESRSRREEGGGRRITSGEAKRIECLPGI